MRSSAPLQRLTRISALKQFTSRPQYRCLHASSRFNEETPSNAKPSSSEASTTTPTKASKSRKPYTNHLIPEEELTVKRARRTHTYRPKSTAQLQPYTKEQLESLKSRYSPEQIAAIEAGEASISTQDIIDQGMLQGGSMSLDYLDDFSQHRAVVDKKIATPDVRDPKTGEIPGFKWKDEYDLVDDLEDWLDKQPADGGSPLNWQKFLNENKLYHSTETNIEERAQDYIAPEIPVIDDPHIRYQARAGSSADGAGEKMAVEYDRLAKQTGFTLEEINSFGFKFLVRRNVVHQTRLGKAQSIYLMVVAGNAKGLLGIGEAKSTEYGDASKKAIVNAIRNIVPIPRYEERTIYGNVKGKSGATELELYARHPGFGARCSSLIWEMCKLAGIRDISARVTRSRTPMNIVKATMQALTSQKDPEEMALARGRRMVDLRRVYYAGNNG